MSVRLAENFSRIFRSHIKFKRKDLSNVSSLEESIMDKIGLKVVIKNKTNNKGSILTEYKRS